MADAVDVYVIGHNNNGEMGLGHNNELSDLTAIKILQNRTKIHCGKKHTIYSDSEYNNDDIWSAGSNYCGECTVGIPYKTDLITKMQQIEYFKKNEIIIKKLFINIAGRTNFWITKNDKVYGNGYNDDFELGINDRDDKSVPVFIESLTNPIQVIASDNYSTALCGVIIDYSIIIVWYYKRYNISIPKDIIFIIECFIGNKNEIFVTNGVYNPKPKGRWDKLNTFNDKNIIKIKSGSRHTLLLEQSGICWVFHNYCYNNETGVLGIGTAKMKKVFEPQRVNYFSDNNIKIIDIQCGLQHNLAIDSNGNVYSWGHNQFGQGGNGTFENIFTPSIITSFRNNAKTVECGGYHSAVCCDDNNKKEWFLFGSNENNECLKPNESNISVPFSINNIIKNQCNGKTIQSVHLGVRNSWFVVI